MLSSYIKILFLEKERQNMEKKSKIRLQPLHVREWEEDGNQITEKQRVSECIHRKKQGKYIKSSNLMNHVVHTVCFY